MKIVFRVDASIEMGTGHVMRCRTLASELRKRGAHIQFITRAHSGNLGDLLLNDGYAVTLLPEPKTVSGKNIDYSDWLGESQQEDARQTILALGNQRADWLIVDHYGIDRVWEERLRPYTRKLMAIDDLANRLHACNLLLDQNYSILGQTRYDSLVDVDCLMLLGPRYALLRPEYKQYRDKMGPRNGKINSILIFMGGSDNSNITGKVLDALSVEQLKHLKVEVVIGSNFIHKIQVIKQANQRPNTCTHEARPHLADLMADADLAIGAGGATTWERLCMGLPSLVMSLADNQVAACQALASSGFIFYLGDGHILTPLQIESALLEALSKSEQLLNSASNNMKLVQGLGTFEIVDILIKN